MIVLCTICSDLINPSENIFVTKCGHLFHYDCLHTWIVRSKSCPQCRHRVTEKCMFRVFPNTTDGVPTGDENAANLQIKLDHAMLKLNQQGLELKTANEKVAEINTALETSENAIKNLEERIISRDSALAAHKEQLLYLKTENKQLKKVQEELEIQKKNVQVLQGLQKVFNATVEEVEHMLEGYADVRTVATFATALKKALYESESKKTDLRNRLQAARQELAEEKKKSAEWQEKYMKLEENFSNMAKNNEIITNKYKISIEGDVSFIDDSWCLMNKSKILSPSNKAKETVTNTSNVSLNTLINKIENADSPYLNLKQSSQSLAAIQHPTTSKGAALLKPIKQKSPKLAATKSTSDQGLSIFQSKDPGHIGFSTDNDQTKSELNISYDGLGGHAAFSELKPRTNTLKIKSKGIIPKLTAKHRLKRPNSDDLQQMRSMMLKRFREMN